MKLYTQNGRWVGTQAEAKREFGEITLVDVPTDKQALLNWLNEHRVGGDTTTRSDISPTVAVADEPKVTQLPMKPHQWQTIRQCAEQASLKDLTVALAVYMNRVDELAEKAGE